jgi:hypothetical protein
MPIQRGRLVAGFINAKQRSVHPGLAPDEMQNSSTTSALEPLEKEEQAMSNKHLRPDETPVDLQDDLERNPGIGESQGLFARTSSRDADLIEGDNTIEGDVENDAGVAGGVSPNLGRTNK